jgi:uncharacterized protein YigE (DUF2233 family)
MLAALVLVTLAAAALLLGPRANNAACTEQNFEGSRFVVCVFDARRQELRLVENGANGQPLRGFRALSDALGADARRVRFAVNAGMFNDAGRPIGLYIENGVEAHRLSLADGPGNFHLKPNGVFWIGGDATVHVETSESYATAGRHPRDATQSGPMLVIGGALHPRFSADGESHYIRNGVGVRDAHVALFVISRDEVSFGRFARFFRDALQCNDALFLDGHVSSLWAPQLNRQDHGFALGPMVVVLNHAQRP